MRFQTEAKLTGDEIAEFESENKEIWEKIEFILDIFVEKSVIFM